MTTVTQPGTWEKISSARALKARRMQVWRDQVVNPGGYRVEYDWFTTSDQVRVAAIVDDHILVVEQHHYLVGSLWQLPGGRIDPGEEALESGRRELAEETGYRGGRWTSAGDLHPLPGLTPMRVYLWIAEQLRPGASHLESGELDLCVHALPLPEAVEAVSTGRVRCAPSAALIMITAALHAGKPPRKPRATTAARP